MTSNCPSVRTSVSRPLACLIAEMVTEYVWDRRQRVSPLATRWERAGWSLTVSAGFWSDTSAGCGAGFSEAVDLGVLVADGASRVPAGGRVLSAPGTSKGTSRGTGRRAGRRAGRRGDLEIPENTTAPATRRVITEKYQKSLRSRRTNKVTPFPAWSARVRGEGRQESQRKNMLRRRGV